MPSQKLLLLPLALALVAISVHAQRPNLIRDTGNVGIGTTNPDAVLDVHGSYLSLPEGSHVDLARFSAFTPNFDRFELFMRRSRNENSWAATDLFLQRKVDITPMGYLKFGHFSASLGVGAVDSIVVTEGGKTGIGTPYPEYTLDVAGTMRAVGRTQQEVTRWISGAEGSTALVGSFSNNVRGKNIRIYLKAHSASVIDVHRYEISEVAYLGATTNWLEIPLNQGAVSHGGNAGYAIDVFRQNINWAGDPLYVRIRTKHNIGDGGVTLVIEYDGDVTFTSQENTSRVSTAFDVTNSPAGGAVDGYYGALEWMFPVSNGSAWANANGAGLYVKNSGNVGIGTTAPSHKLTVNGAIRAKEVIVDTGWADYVFASSYHLQTLDEVEQHIKEKGRLPGVPSAAEVVKEGMSIGEIQTLMMAKMEEITLHQIDLQKKQRLLEVRVKELEQENAALKNQATQSSE